MTLHAPACQARLYELLTTPNTSVDHRIAEWVSHVPEPEARDFLLTVMDDDHGTHAADIAREIWRLAADTTTEREGGAMNPDGIAYVKALLESEEKGTLPRTIAERVWVLSMETRDEVLEYLTSIMSTNVRHSEAWQIAADLVRAMGITGVAA